MYPDSFYIKCYNVKLCFFSYSFWGRQRIWTHFWGTTYQYHLSRGITRRKSFIKLSGTSQPFPNLQVMWLTIFYDVEYQEFGRRLLKELVCLLICGSPRLDSQNHNAVWTLLGAIYNLQARNGSGEPPSPPWKAKN